jgi:RNA polymerase sigma-70 factor (ECF subfamily)
LLGVDQFERYYEDIRPGLLRFVTARIRDHHAARDVVQDVYAKAFRSLDRYDPRRPFTTWIYAIARNACVDFLRRRTRDPLAGLAPNAPATPPDLDALPAGGGWDPAFAAERRDLVEAARAELEKLPDNRRAAVEMKIIEGLTYREVAEALGAPLGTVAFWVRQALDSIAERLRHLK